ncbi:MAG: 2-amino-4-hydroxy-6-hydroxymethyldihydropteridine diphosphokinase [Candidatus Acetothermia bacterium]|jgi:2-amino-4-hydroxy-6-hydroxymethyldihydropteridine diphosphokinase|nr:2-amino-4-hydroxy-6-hydroxymethyldihydropteridine diphosphokinase [Candidatus Acetothermia bacterium]MDH7505445.1 2-amino-4-hydroxy-6-hydroxymethyldihydropteridine diphosphokinase [Candidatus Acetothermia bacterium]
MRAFIGIGANLGEREEQIARAVGLLARTPGLELLRQASLYLTEPVGGVAQPWFINSAVEVETELGPQELLRRLKEIELEVGRRERGRWGPREIDLDLLLYGELVLEEDGLVLPHPELHRRRFVLEPLVELAPALVHPWLKRSLCDLLSALDDQKKVIRLDWKRSS